jgi:secondary thiamine-phosphate synthase enzyme
MFSQLSEEVTVSTRGRGFYELTGEIASIVSRSGVSSGLATLHVQHTSASLLIQENADPEVRTDLERIFSRLVPDGDPIFQHTYEGEDDMPAHVRTALTCVNMNIPIREGRMTLGTWQGIFLWEHRYHGHHRRISVHVMGE